jgi:predicted ATPase
MARLVGRDVALAMLRRYTGEARAGRGHFVLIDGEPGIGKTTLAAAAADEAVTGGAQLAWGVCVSGEGVPDFWPWPEIVAEAGGEPAALAGPAGSGPDAWFSAATAVVAALRAAAARAPVVVVVDDLQWAGPGTVRVLDFAARGLRRHPVLLLGTYRGVEVAAAHPLSAVLPAAEVVPLAGLAAADVAELLRPALGARADRLAAAVHTRTGGNPFFVQQVGLLAAGGHGDAVPAAVGDAIRRRFARLPQPTATLLGTAAVAGRVVDAALVAEAAGLDLANAVTRLEPAVDARVLRPAGLGMYQFGHDLFRETAYADLAPGARAGTHLALARVLVSRREAGADIRAGDIAHHWARAVPPADPAEALHHVEAAARDATMGLAHEEAARHWQQALRLAELAGPVAGGLRADYGEALLRAGQTDAARQVLRDAAARTADPVTLARCALGLHQAGLASGLSHAEVIALLGQAVSALDAATAGHPPPSDPGRVSVPGCCGSRAGR